MEGEEGGEKGLEFNKQKRNREEEKKKGGWIFLLPRDFDG